MQPRVIQSMVPESKAQLIRHGVISCCLLTTLSVRILVKEGNLGGEFPYQSAFISNRFGKLTPLMSGPDEEQRYCRSGISLEEAEIAIGEMEMCWLPSSCISCTFLQS